MESSTDGSDESPARALVVVQAGSAGPATYCFHAFGGSVAPYGQLATHLGRDRRLFGLQAVGLHPGTAPHRSVLAMAHRYAMEIADDAPVGPAVFLGYSMGGQLALETARLLTNLLDEPPLVVAVDSDPRYRSQRPEDAWSLLVHQVLNLDSPVPGLSARPRTEALAAVRAAAAAERKLPPRFSLERLARMADVCQANERAAAQYRPQPYAGRTASVRSTATAAGLTPSAPDPWAEYVPHLVTRYVPGDHHSIMTKAGYPLLAAVIRELLDTVPTR